jgi:hypothetical protein
VQETKAIKACVQAFAAAREALEWDKDGPRTWEGYLARYREIHATAVAPLVAGIGRVDFVSRVSEPAAAVSFAFACEGVPGTRAEVARALEANGAFPGVQFSALTGKAQRAHPYVLSVINAYHALK